MNVLLASILIMMLYFLLFFHLGYSYHSRGCPTLVPKTSGQSLQPFLETLALWQGRTAMHRRVFKVYGSIMWTVLCKLWNRGKKRGENISIVIYLLRKFQIVKSHFSSQITEIVCLRLVFHAK